MPIAYAQDMKHKIGPGRPKIPTAEAFTCRHVVNITPRMEEEVRQYAVNKGIARLSDALRQLVATALRQERGEP